MTGKKRCEDWGLSSSTCPRQTTGTLRSLLRILAFPNSYFFLCPSVMAGGTSWSGWKAFLFSLQIAACAVDSSPSLSWYWGMSQNPGLFIFHIMCTLIGTLHRRDFLRKHWFSLLTTLLQTHFSPFLFPFCHRYDSFFYSFFFFLFSHFFQDMNPLPEFSQISALGHGEILSLRQSRKRKVVHGGNCDSCRNWNDEAEAAIMKTQRCSETYWWKGKSLGFSALKGFCILEPDEGRVLLSSLLAC